MENNMYKSLFDTIAASGKAATDDERQRLLENNYKTAMSFIKREEGTINSMLKVEFVSCSEKEGWVTLRFPVQEWERNPGGIMHGGIIMTVMDVTMGIVGHFCSNASSTPTISMSVNFLKAVPIGENLLITVTPKQKGRNIVSLVGEGIIEGSGKTAVTAIGTFFIASEGGQELAEK